MAKYRLTDDEAVAFVTAMMGGLTYGPISEEDGYRRGDGWKRGTQVLDREVRALLAANVLAEIWMSRDKAGVPTGRPTLVRGSREIDDEGVEYG